MLVSDLPLLAYLAPLFEPSAALRSLPAVMVLSGTFAALTVLNLAAPGLGLVDHPDGGRKRHARPVPLTGGLAILTGAGLGAMAGMSIGTARHEVLALLAIVAVIHAFDDQAAGRRPTLSPPQRLVIDAIVALALILVTERTIETLGTVSGIALELGPLAIPFTIVIYLALTNAYNMIDGLDGLALSQFLIAFVGIGFWHLAANDTRVLPHALPPATVPIILASLVVLAANLGVFGAFLRCFLGDSGARLLGFFLVYVLVAEGGRVFSPPGALFFVALPLLDLCAVMIERLRAGASPMRGDRRHLHHLLLDAGLRPSRVVMVFGLISVSFIGLHAVIHTTQLGDLALLLSFLALATLYWLARRRLVRGLGKALTRPPVVEPAE